MDASLDALIALVKQVGFPAATAFWFMFRTDKRMDKLVEEIAALRVAMAKEISDLRAELARRAS